MTISSSLFTTRAEKLVFTFTTSSISSMRNWHNVIDNVWTPWDTFPNWHSAYSFGERPSPYTGPSVLYIDSSPCLTRGVVRYQADPEAPPPAPLPGVLSRLFGRRWTPSHPIYFTSFIWYDKGGYTCECTREELCRAFHRLVGDWQELFTLACAAWSAWEAPFLTYWGQELDVNCPQVRGRKNQLYHQIIRDAKRWSACATELWREVELFAQYLSRFARMESSGEMPHAFSRYPGKVGCKLSARFSRPVRMKKTNDIDDWVFRFTKIINQYESSWDKLHGIHSMKAVLVKIRTDILNAKGYGPREGAKHLNAVTGVRHVPPPPER